ncbi:lysozyme [Vibrio sp. H11]|uniref:lysozyme n=1 Tax=Vibrio sp. H11 TaxID=2565928 RepID=UPI0010A5FD4A|nr:lysozyme [Vibrio sp. H11]
MSRISKTVKVLAAAGASALTIAVSMVKPFEGQENVPYYDVVGVLTVCFGHTGPDIVEGKVYTQQECQSLLEQDLLAVKHQVDPLIPPTIPDTTRAALYSFTFNVGVGAFKRSTLLKRLNAGDLVGACNELKRWVYAGGKKWNGLINRRQVEEEVCKLHPP